MATTTNDRGNRIMNDHGVYPLLDNLTNAALLQTVCGDGRKEDHVDLYVDAKGFHLVWRQVKKDKNGDAILNGGNLLLETKSKDVTAEFAKKLDYDGEAPDFTTTPKDKDDGPWSVAAPEVSDGYAFTLCGLMDNNGTHVSHVFATDDIHSRLLLAPGSEQQNTSLEHMMVATAIHGLTSDDTTRLETEADILSKAKELMK